MLKSIREDESKGLTVEVVAVDPSSPKRGRLWFNTSEGVLKLRIGTINKILAYASDIWKHLGGEGQPIVKDGAVTYDIVGGLKPPEDATRNVFLYGADAPVTGMKKGDFWIKNVGKPPFEIYQYDGIMWRKSVYSDFGEMLGNVSANQLLVFDWFLSDPNWLSNTPSAGYISWSQCALTFEGVSHEIAAGNTNKRYIWWDEDSPDEFRLTDNKAEVAPMAEDALLCTNEEGITYPALTGTMIHGGRIYTGSITADEIKAGEITTEKLNVVDWFPENLVWTDNSPSSGYIAWSACSITYSGVKYDIGAGNTNLKFIWWDYSLNPNAFQTSATQPPLADNDCVICVNEEGIAHQILQATIIHGGAILTSSVEAAQIKAGTITADLISLVGIDANGKLKLAEIGSGDFDNIPEGTTYGRYLKSALQDSKALLSAAVGSLGDIDDDAAGGYGKVLVNDITSGHVLLASTEGDLDDIADGTDYGKISTTYITAGHGLFATGVEETDTLKFVDAAEKDGAAKAWSWRHPDNVTFIDGGDIYTGTVTTDQIKLSSLTSDPGYSLCKIWYRSDVDQLRIWGTSSSEPFKIPRIPVSSSVYITPAGFLQKYEGSSISTTYTSAKCTDPNADQTSTHTANNAANYTGSTVGTSYTAAKCTDPYADRTSTHTANNASNYTGSSISTSYTSAKCTDPLADRTSTHNCLNPGDYTEVTRQAHTWLTNAPATSHHPNYLKGGYTYWGGTVSIGSYYGPYTKDCLIEILASAYGEWGPMDYILYAQVYHGTLKTVGKLRWKADEDQEVSWAGTVTFLVPEGDKWKVTLGTLPGVDGHGEQYSRQDLATYG